MMSGPEADGPDEAPACFLAESAATKSSARPSRDENLASERAQASSAAAAVGGPAGWEGSNCLARSAVCDTTREAAVRPGGPPPPPRPGGAPPAVRPASSLSRLARTSSFSSDVPPCCCCPCCPGAAALMSDRRSCISEPPRLRER